MGPDEIKLAEERLRFAIEAMNLTIKKDPRYRPDAEQQQALLDPEEWVEFLKREDGLYAGEDTIIHRIAKQRIVPYPGRRYIHCSMLGANFEDYFNAGGMGGEFQRLALPFWMPMAALLIAPGARGVAYHRSLRARRRRARGLCAGCGYDLRATREKCPECGRVMEGRT